MILRDGHRGKWIKKATLPPFGLLRRHLQQLLFVDSVHISSQNGLASGVVLSEAHILGSVVPNLSSLCMFRFLLSVYVYLERPDVIEDTLRDYLQTQIQHTCRKHLDRTFDFARPLEEGWARSYNLDGSYAEDEVNDISYAAMQFIKLYEFRMVFQTPEEHNFVLQKLGKRLGPCFESLEKLRNVKSGLWDVFYS